MVDPLSIIAGAIAIGQAADRLSSLISKAQSMKGAPAEIGYLMDEVLGSRHFHSQLQNSIGTLATQISRADCERLQVVLFQYAGLLEQLQSNIDKYLIRPPAYDDGKGTVTIRRRGWAFKKSQIEEQRDKLRHTRALISGEISSISLLHQVRFRTAIDARLERQEALLKRVLRSREGSEKAETSESQSPEGRQGLQVRSSAGRPCQPIASCSSRCPCRCHSQWTMVLSSGWRALMGQLAVRTQGHPVFPQACDVRSCSRRTTPSLGVWYYLPHWLAVRAIVLTLLNGPSPSISLKVTRLVPLDSDLLRFIQVGDTCGVQDLFRQGRASPADVVRLGDGTIDVLLFALNCGKLEVCQVLLAWGADPHAINDTALTGSATDMAWNLGIECPSPAKEGGLSVQDIFPVPQDLDSRGFTPLHEILTGLRHASIDDAIAKTPPGQIDEPDLHSRAAIHYAAWVGNAHGLMLLLAAGADPNLRDRGGRAAIFFSSMTFSTACTAILVEAGADPNMIDDFHETPLHGACATGRVPNVEYLLSLHVDVDMRNMEGRTPLMAATLAEELEVVRILALHGADLRIKDTAGETAATLAVWVDAGEIVTALGKRGATFDAVSGCGRTVLHTAAQFAGIGTMEALLGAEVELGDVDGAALDGQGRTALEKLRERPDLTPELLEVFGALLLKASPRGAQKPADSTLAPDKLGSRRGSTDSEEEGETFVLAHEEFH